MLRETLIAILLADEIPQGVITLTGEFSEEDGAWIGTCLELGTPACAETLSQVRKELSEAIDLQLNEMARLGHTTDYLKQMGVPLLTLPAKMRPQFPTSSAPSKVEWGIAEAAA